MSVRATITRTPEPQPGRPSWLADFLIQPPLWFKALLFIAAGLCILVAVWRVYERDIYISTDEHRAMILILGTVEGVGIGTAATMNLTEYGYLADVGIGLTVGFLAVELLRRVGWLLDGRLEEEVQLVLGWAAIAYSPFVLRYAGLGDGVLPLTVDSALMGIGHIMLLWVLLQEFGDVETLGELFRQSG